MRTLFWRFAYENELLKTILESDKLYFPNLKDWPLSKNNSEDKLISEIRTGHFILLANFNLTSEIGTVRGVGKVTEIKDNLVSVLWKKPIPSWSLAPNLQGGLQQWKTEGVFCFDVEPAKRYKLDALTKKLFKNT